ncbi:hypothetical protein VaNZ11_017209 [Volvox africanus]|uniref:Bromo domain-containing protein n=1 Tax=Volvox africanus TaxID=51714 RepID=A0ABQ5SQB2_9CHLO|nr:hypothetical protein VaNZ11_017209 [Volvox africanus]
MIRMLLCLLNQLLIVTCSLFLFVEGATFLGLPDRFVAVEIENEAPPAFDAAQYSFFGDLAAASSALEGALEDGLEAPPAEEGISSQDYGLHGADEDNFALEEEEDLSVASIFRHQLGLGPARSPTKRVDPDDDAGLDALLTDPLSVARKQLRDDDDYDHRELPSELFPEAVPNSVTPKSQPLFGSTSTSRTYRSYRLFDGHGDTLGATESNDGTVPIASIPVGIQPEPRQALQLPRPSPLGDTSGSVLLPILKRPSQTPVKAMTLEELEARMFGNAEGTAAAAWAPSAPMSIADAVRVHMSSGAIGLDALSAAGPNEQQSGGMLPRPVPSMPIGNPGARAAPPQGSRMPVMMGSSAPSPGFFHPQLPAPAPPVEPIGLGSQQPQGALTSTHHHNPLQSAATAHGSVQMPMGLSQPPPGTLGGSMYPPPSPMGAGQVGAGPHTPKLMYHGNGLLPLAPSHHQHTPGPGTLPGSMPLQMYASGAAYPPRGPASPYGPTSMVVGSSQPYMFDNYMMRPVGGQPGVPSFMHGLPPRPGPFGCGSPGLGPGLGQGQQPQQPGPQRPFMLAGQPQPLPGSGGLRPSLGPGAPGPRLVQARPPNKQQTVPDLGSQVARVNGGPGASGSGPIALAAAAAAGRTGPAASVPGGRLGGKWMRLEDVEYVVRSMLHTVANGVPYVEDYYYQAFVHKHVSQVSSHQLSPGAFPMAAPFVPESLRELSEDQMSMMRLDPSARAKFVEGLQGLGKIVLSNIRTPKVLMDLSDQAVKRADSTDVDKGADRYGRSARPLEQEPLLAARIMVEDCMNLLLDVDDIDRLANHMAAMAQAKQRAASVAAALPMLGGPVTAASAMAATSMAGPYGPSSAAAPPLRQLRQRRELLLAGINGAFRLPYSARGTASSGMEADNSGDSDAMGAGTRVSLSIGDGVLRRILALSKGRRVVARALLAIAPPANLVLAVAPKPAPRPSRQTRSSGTGSEQTQGSDTPTPPAERAGTQQLEDAHMVGGAEEGMGSSLLGADAPSPYSLLWGTLRNAWTIFGSSLQQGVEAAAERASLEATSRLAAALREALLRLPTPRDVVDAAAAFNVGCQQHIEAICQGNPAMAGSMEATLLPLAQTRAVEPPASASGSPSVPVTPVAWLGEALAALVIRASQLGLATEPPPAVAIMGARERLDSERAVDSEWRREYRLLHERLSRHLVTLRDIHLMAVSSANAEALAVVRALSCRLLVNAMLQHASVEQAQELKTVLATLTA